MNIWEISSIVIVLGVCVYGYYQNKRSYDGLGASRFESLYREYVADYEGMHTYLGLAASALLFLAGLTFRYWWSNTSLVFFGFGIIALFLFSMSNKHANRESYEVLKEKFEKKD